VEPRAVEAARRAAARAALDARAAGPAVVPIGEAARRKGAARVAAPHSRVVGPRFRRTGSNLQENQLDTGEDHWGPSRAAAPAEPVGDPTRALREEPPAAGEDPLAADRAAAPDSLAEADPIAVEQRAEVDRREALAAALPTGEAAREQGRAVPPAVRSAEGRRQVRVVAPQD